MGSYFFHNFQNHISPIAGGQMFWTSKAKIGATGRVIIPVSKKFDHIIEDWTWNIERSHVTVLWKGFDWFDLNNYVAHFVAGHAQKVVCSDQQWTEFANVSGSFSRTSSCLQGKKKTWWEPNQAYQHKLTKRRIRATYGTRKKNQRTGPESGPLQSAHRSEWFVDCWQGQLRVQGRICLIRLLLEQQSVSLALEFTTLKEGRLQSEIALKWF